MSPIYLPERYGPLAEIPGQLVSVDADGWALVDLGSYGVVGCPLVDLKDKP